MRVAVHPTTMLRSSLRTLALVLQGSALLTLALALGGCGPGNAWGALIAGALSLAGLVLAGCSASHVPENDGAVDAGGDAGGYWERCCESGHVSSCYCPAGWACNYGWFNDCGDGTCVDLSLVCPNQDAGVDAGPDAGGAWEPCCVDGRVTTCFCPSGVECNYGWYNDCGDGSCVDPSLMCPTADAGADGGGGYWEPCCVEGAISTCFCPAGVACNYGMYTDCGNDVCVGPLETCPASP